MNIRRIIQSFIFSISIITGVRFALYLDKIQSGIFDAAKPSGVEAFLPISSLMALKRLILVGEYDYIHPAGLSLFIIFLLISVLFKRAFCGYICPVGFFSEIVSMIGFNKSLSGKPSWFLSLPKYLVFGFFFYFIAVSMPVSSIEKFLQAPYNVIADAKMLDFFLNPSRATIIFLIAMIFITLVVRGFWCRYLCPYGVLHSVAGFLSPFSVRRSASACTNCLKCSAVCPAGIDVHLKTAVTHPDCIGCYDCVRVRSNPNCLKIGRRGISPKIAAVAVAIIFVSAVALSMTSGHWKSSVTNAQYLLWYDKKEMLSH